MTTDSSNKIVARPSKHFFVDMITRDLSVTDCILDLIDNAVDQAVEANQFDAMKILNDGESRPSLAHASISVTFSTDEFKIADTCGGISIEKARTQIFLFGNHETRGAPNGLSVFGIGMKRAFFKIGKLITVRSATQNEWWEMNIDVEEWLNRPDVDDWSFDFYDSGTLSDDDNQTPGTTITIRQLEDGVKKRFSQTPFRKQLNDKLATAYALFIEGGLSIDVDGGPVESGLPVFGKAEEITAARTQFSDDGVDILIIASVTPREDRTPRGWYVFCNGRMVLEADKGVSTGWGGGGPVWHTKYGHFIGYVYFRSADVHKLPWTTTKQSVVIDLPLYQRVLAEMQVQSRPVLNFLNKLYPGDVEAEGLAERDVLESAEVIRINEVARTDSVFTVVLPQRRASSEDYEVNIQFKKRRKEIDRIKECVPRLRRASARKIGEYSFDYLMRQECP